MENRVCWSPRCEQQVQLVIDQPRRSVCDKKKHAQECALWYKSTQGGMHDIQGIFERNTEIMNHVEIFGFTEVLYKLPPMKRNPLETFRLKVNSEQSLWFSSDPINEPALGRLENHIHAELGYQSRIRELLEYDAFFDARKAVLTDIHQDGTKNLPENTVYPNLASFYRILDKYDLMDYSKIGQDALRIPFDKVVALWREHVDDKLIQYIGTVYPEYKSLDPATIFNLATTFFLCEGSKCNAHMHRHNCIRTTPMGHDEPAAHACTRSVSHCTLEWQSFGKVFGAAEWLTVDGHTRFSERATKIMQDVVGMCGLDPRTTTFSQMQAMNPIFKCVECVAAKEDGTTMSWTGVLEHQGTAHEASTDTRAIRILFGSEASRIQQHTRM